MRPASPSPSASHTSVVIEARNGLDSLVYNIEKMLKESGEKVEAADKGEVESALAEAKD